MKKLVILLIVLLTCSAFAVGQYVGFQKHRFIIEGKYKLGYELCITNGYDEPSCEYEESFRNVEVWEYYDRYTDQTHTQLVFFSDSAQIYYRGNWKVDSEGKAVLVQDENNTEVE